MALGAALLELDGAVAETGGRDVGGVAAGAVCAIATFSIGLSVAGSTTSRWISSSVTNLSPSRSRRRRRGRGPLAFARRRTTIGESTLPIRETDLDRILTLIPTEVLAVYVGIRAGPCLGCARLPC